MSENDEFINSYTNKEYFEKSIKKDSFIKENFTEKLIFENISYIISRLLLAIFFIILYVPCFMLISCLFYSNTTISSKKYEEIFSYFFFFLLVLLNVTLQKSIISIILSTFISFILCSKILNIDLNIYKKIVNFNKINNDKNNLLKKEKKNENIFSQLLNEDKFRSFNKQLLKSFNNFLEKGNINIDNIELLNMLIYVFFLLIIPEIISKFICMINIIFTIIFIILISICICLYLLFFICCMEVDNFFNNHKKEYTILEILSRFKYNFIIN